MDNVEVAKSNNLTLFNPSFIDDYGLTPEEFRVFARIMRRASGEHSEGCFESVPKMAMTLGISERLVRESLQVLQQCGCIQVLEREGQSHLITFNVCDFWVPKIQVPDIRYRISGTRKERDRERKITPSGNATPVGNARGPLAETQDKGIPLKSIPIEEENDTLHYVPCDEDGNPLPPKKEKRKNAFGARPPRAPRTSTKTPAMDVRLRHPIIVAIKEVSGYLPDPILRDELIERFGETFDVELLKKCRAAWVRKGYNKNATTWTDWYFDGIPEYAATNGNGKTEAPSKWNHVL